MIKTRIGTATCCIGATLAAVDRTWATTPIKLIRNMTPIDTSCTRWDVPLPVNNQPMTAYGKSERGLTNSNPYAAARIANATFLPPDHVVVVTVACAFKPPLDS